MTEARTPDPEGDGEARYLAAVLALDPADSAFEILRLRRKFLGRPANPPAPEIDGEARKARTAALREREKEARARAKSLVRAHDAPPRPRAAARAGGAGGSLANTNVDWRWIVVLVVLSSIITALRKTH